MNRRSFLQSMIIACAAPAIVRAESIMRIAAPKLIMPAGLVLAQPAAAYTLSWYAKIENSVVWEHVTRAVSGPEAAEIIHSIYPSRMFEACLRVVRVSFYDNLQPGKNRIQLKSSGKVAMPYLEIMI